MSGKLKLGQILVRKGLIDPDQLAAALGEQERSGGRLGRTLVRLGYLEEEALIRVLASQLRVPVARVAGKTVKQEILDLVPLELAQKHRCLPLFSRRDAEGPVLLIAMEDPSDGEALAEITARTGQRVRPVLVGPAELEDALQRHYHVEAPPPEPSGALAPVPPPAPAAAEPGPDDAARLAPQGSGLDPALDASAGDLDLELPLDGSAEAAGERAPDTRPDQLLEHSSDALRDTDPDGLESLDLADAGDARSEGAERGNGAGPDLDDLESGAGASLDDLESGADAGLDDLESSAGAGLDELESSAGASLDDLESSADAGLDELESGAGASLAGDLSMRLDGGPGASLDGDLGEGFETGAGASLGAGLESGAGASLDGGFGDSFGASHGSLGSTLDGSLVVPVERPPQPAPSRAPARGGLDPQLILRALSQLLVEKGVITRDELAERLRRVAAEADGA
jgi:hypothetical protein